MIEEFVKNKDDEKNRLFFVIIINYSEGYISIYPLLHGNVSK